MPVLYFIVLHLFEPIPTFAHQEKASNLFHWRSKGAQNIYIQTKQSQKMDNVWSVYSLTEKCQCSFSCGWKIFFTNLNFFIECHYNIYTPNETKILFKSFRNLCRFKEHKIRTTQKLILLFYVSLGKVILKFHRINCVFNPIAAFHKSLVFIIFVCI